MIERLLPEFCYSSRAIDISGIAIHYISAINVAPDRWDDMDTIWNMLVELNRPGSERGPLLERDEHDRAYASYHGVIDRAGNPYQLTPWHRQAYHAGVSEWNGRKNCNAWMAGIALIGTHDSGFTDAQYVTLIEECATLRALHDISLRNITGHEHIAPGRKVDPGPKFSWERLKSEL